MNVTTQQAADLLGVTRQSITRYIWDGRLKARRHGLRSYIISLEILRDFATKHNMAFDETHARQLAQYQ